MVREISIVISVFALVALAYLLIAVLTKLKSSKREFFVMFLFCGIIYVFGVMFQLMATTSNGVALSLQLISLGGVLMPPVLFLFCQNYYEHRFPKWVNPTLFLTAFLLIAFMWTSEWHELIHRSIYLLDEQNGVRMLSWSVIRGPLFFLVVVHPTVCLFLSLVILIQELRRSADVAQRKRASVLILCAAIPSIIQMVNVVQLGDFLIQLAIALTMMLGAFVAYLRYFKYYLLDNEEVTQSKSAVRTMIANVSHDLKTPLTVLSANLEKLLTASPGDPDYFRDIQIAYNRSLDLQRLIGNLVDITRMESAPEKIYKLEWVSLNSVLADVQGKYGDYLESLNLTLDVSGCGGDVSIKIDPVAIWSVFDNIIYNAARHTATGGLTITAECLGDDITTIALGDTGCGIAPKYLPHIFERFYKVEQEKEAWSGHSGVGLFVVKNVMEALGGQVRMESEVGVGTTVFLMFEKRRKEE